jgi:ribonuclease D
MQIHPLISDSKRLAELCARLAKSPFVAVDTEFMRENTYYPDLCLVQLADTHEAAAIDPKAEGLDLTPMLDLLCANDDVLKVFHAGGQDILQPDGQNALPHVRHPNRRHGTRSR